MNTNRRPKDTKFTTRVKFEPYLVTLGIFLNVLASGAAAFSAWNSWRQIPVAIEAVNTSSKNASFVSFMQSFAELCKVSLVEADQDEFLTDGFPAVKFDGAPFYFEIRTINDDYLPKVETPEVDAFLAEVGRKRSLAWEKLQELSIWIDNKFAQTLAQALPYHSAAGIANSRLPPSYYAIEKQIRCRRNLKYATALFKNPNDIEAERRLNKPIWVLPASADRTTGEILELWGRSDIIDTLRYHEIWPRDDSMHDHEG